MSGEKRPAKSEGEKKAPRPARVDRKIGEKQGNLRRREHWFRKRAGGGEATH